MNYYEQLNIDQNADQSTIETALDMQYDRWRALVINHDPEVVAKANQALLSLEEMRKTLLDPGKKSNYDQELQQQDLHMGVLADPSLTHEVHSPSLTMAPPRPRRSQAGDDSYSMASADTWICSKCKQLNQPMTRFCKKCGQQIGIDCPSCGSLVHESSKFCDNCGVNIREELQRKALEEEEAEQRYQEVLKERAKLEPYIKKADDIKKLTSIWWVVPSLFFTPIIGLIVYGLGLLKATQFLNVPQISGIEDLREEVKRNKNRTLILLIIYGILSVIVFLCVTIIFLPSVGSMFGEF